jgi:5-methylcytosine-specific restriction endonuclease McrA
MAKKKTATPKTRNAGTMTESAFWSFIRSALRQKSRWWKPIAQAKQKAKRAYKGPLKRQKFEYQCNQCKEWFPDKKINVDHIIPAGSLNCANDLPGFVDRLFCEVNNLQVLCSECHNIKTQKEKNGK